MQIFSSIPTTKLGVYNKTHNLKIRFFYIAQTNTPYNMGVAQLPSFRKAILPRRFKQGEKPVKKTNEEDYYKTDSMSQTHNCAG